MALDISTFETITPSRFVTFTILDPINPNSLFRVAVLDSPIHHLDAPRVAAMLVPTHRESDWTFSTELGHLQLLLSVPSFSRLISIGSQNSINGPNSQPVFYRPENPDQEQIEHRLMPLLMALCPKTCFENGIPDVPFLSFEDNVVCSVVLEKCMGVFVGEMLVEDVEIEIESDCDVGSSRNFGKREFRRRLRFKRMPNLVQTEIRIVPETGFELNCVKFGDVAFRPDLGVLVHSYLVPMVAALSLVGGTIEEKIRRLFKPKALCVGVGGGALLAFLKNQLDFEVVGVDVDKEVLRIARKYFGLEDSECIRVFVKDAIGFLQELAHQANGKNSGLFGVHDVGNNSFLDNDHNLDTKFDVIMVDLDSSDAINGVSAPPLEFVRESVLLNARSVLCHFGILVVNVIPPNRLFYETFIHDFRKVFCELYEIDVGNGENFVLVATTAPIVSSISDCEKSFVTRLRSVISGAYMDSIRKI